LGLARLIPPDKVKSTSPSVSRIQNEWTVTIVDIGQGLSIILERDGRRVVYDSGPRFSTYPSTAQRVFPAYGNMPIDMLINSHYDNDHAGGNTFILGNYHVGQLFGPDQGCNREQQELIGSEWQNLKIEVLWPLVPMSGEDNNHSCVLRINDGVHTWLLTGDIEAEVESALLKHYVENVTGGKNKLKADFLIAPHHGSKTSSSEIFISAVRPTHVFIGSKYYNHWGFPHEDPFENYKKVGAEVHNTAYDGAIKMTLLPNKFGQANSYKIETMRGRWTSPWYMKVRVPSTKPQ
jgi:competence protein ComEC